MKNGFSKMAVFSQFGGFGGFVRFCPFCILPRGPLGTKNSQKSLEIIIYIQTANHKNFSMWWHVGFPKWPFLPNLADLAVLAYFIHFFKYHCGQQTARKSLKIIIYIQTASHKNFLMWWHVGFPKWPFLPNFADFADLAVLARYIHFLGYHWGQQTARKIWKL